MRPEKNSVPLPPKIWPDSGTIEHRYVRCGRANCKCTKGELHGPYVYTRIYRNGKRWRKYVKKDEISAFSEARNQRMLQKEAAKKEMAEFRQQWRELKNLLRSVGL